MVTDPSYLKQKERPYRDRLEVILANEIIKNLN